MGLAVALVATAAVVAIPLGPERTWREGSIHGGWRTVFTGYGAVHGERGSITLHPTSPQSASATHAALVVDTRRVGDMSSQGTIVTHAQLRPAAPNPWEVGWFLWHFTDPGHFYGVVLKPTGWEISKQDPSYPGGQRFLASGTSPVFALGAPHTVSVSQRGATFTVSAGGRTLATVTDTERPYLWGAVGLYTEDAHVTFTNIAVGVPP